MYYSYQCSYCSRLFFTYTNYRKQAASTLYHGIKQHLIDYNEDHMEYQFDEHPQIEVHQMYDSMEEHETRPPGGYEL